MTKTVVKSAKRCYSEISYSEKYVFHTNVTEIHFFVHKSRISALYITSNYISQGKLCECIYRFYIQWLGKYYTVSYMWSAMSSQITDYWQFLAEQKLKQSSWVRGSLLTVSTKHEQWIISVCKCINNTPAVYKSKASSPFISDVKDNVFFHCSHWKRIY